MKLKQYFLDFKYPHDTILQSRSYAHLPPSFLKLKASWEKIKRKIEGYLANKASCDVDEFFDRVNDCDWESIEEFFVKTCWGWKPTGWTVNFEETDRLGQHYYGAMYTSAKYPWPMCADIPYHPILQIDIDKVGDIIDANIGGGFLQLYISSMIGGDDSDGWYFLRHIPRNEISEDFLTSIPQFTDAQISRAIGKYSDSGFNEFFANSSEAIHIEKFSHKHLSFYKFIFNGSDEDFFRILSEDFTDLYAMAEKDITDFNLALEEFKCQEHEHNNGKAMLFGYYQPIQEFSRNMHSPIFTLGSLADGVQNLSQGFTAGLYEYENGVIFLEFDENATPKYFFYHEF